MSGCSSSPEKDDQHSTEEKQGSDPELEVKLEETQEESGCPAILYSVISVTIPGAVGQDGLCDVTAQLVPDSGEPWDFECSAAEDCFCVIFDGVGVRGINDSTIVISDDQGVIERIAGPFEVPSTSQVLCGGPGPSVTAMPYQNGMGGDSMGGAAGTRRTGADPN
jgi:hypothetical protein